FRIRIGIHAGPVVVGKIGDDLRMDYTAVGDTTNLAARLQQAAPAGAVLISDTTAQLVRGYFETEDAGDLQLKGKSVPVRVHLVVRERSMHGRIEATAAEGLTPLVGRDSDLAALVAAHRAASEGQGRVVFLVGEAGMGKSRLLYEFHERLEGTSHAWVEGRCASFARDTAFYVVADCMRRRLGIDDRDDDQQAIAKIEASREMLGADLDWTVPYVRHLLSLPSGDAALEKMDAATRRSETARALLARFRRLCELRTLVLVVEDLHWIDAESEEFLQYLVESIPADRALIVLTYRPGYEHPFGDRSYHARLGLQPLTAAAMESMTRSVLDTEDIPPELRTAIARKAEGNPFFIEEVAKSLVEEGVLERSSAGLRMASDAGAFTIPDSIHDVLAARLDRLDDESKRAIQTASIIGREFALRLLSRISDLSETVSDVVTELRSLELIYEKRDHPELAYMFKHALTHEVAYQSVLMQRRKVLHAAVGTAIEDLYQDRISEHYEALAHHFTLAESWPKALEYLELAADKSFKAYANQAAVVLLRRALEVCDRLGTAVTAEQRGRLEYHLGDALNYLNDFRAAGEHYLKAAEVESDPERKSLTLCLAAHAFHWGHDYDRDETTVEAALGVAREHGSTAGQACGEMLQGFFAATQRGDMAAYTRGVDRALERAGDHVFVASFARSMRAQIAEWIGDFDESIRLNDAIMPIFQEIGRPDLLIQTAWFKAKSLTCLGRYAEAVVMLEECIDLCERVGARAFQARLLNTLGWCYGEMGAYEQAMKLNRRALEMAGRMVELDLVAGASELYANAGVNLANDLIARGEPAAAGDVLGPIREELAVDEDPWQRWRYSLHVDDAVARISLARGEPEDALRLVDAELSRARTSTVRKVEARALELRGRTLLAMERHDEAVETLTNGLEVGRTLRYPPAIWRCLYDLAELARRRGSRADADRHTAEADTLIESLAVPLADTVLAESLRRLGSRLAADPHA
ncbi:MAG: tetratricopeptide repeat protein, partial [Myxococcales bacterium]